MTDEPGGWELKRALADHRTDMREGFKSINERLDRLVSSDAYMADQRRVDDRLKELADDIAAEQRSRAEAIALERETRTVEVNKEVTNRKAAIDALQTSMDKMVQTQRWVAAAIIIPIALFVANIVIAKG
jgi:hypothetical protein